MSEEAGGGGAGARLLAVSTRLGEGCIGLAWAGGCAWPGRGCGIVDFSTKCSIDTSAPHSPFKDASKLGASKSRELQGQCFEGRMVTVVGRSRMRMTATRTTTLPCGLPVEAVYKMLPTPSTARLRYLCGFEHYESFTKSFLDFSAPSRK